GAAGRIEYHGIRLETLWSQHLGHEEFDQRGRRVMRARAIFATDFRGVELLVDAADEFDRDDIEFVGPKEQLLLWFRIASQESLQEVQVLLFHSLLLIRVLREHVTVEVFREAVK